MNASFAGKEGYALMLISPSELNLYKKLCRNLDRDDGIGDFVVDDAYMGAVRKRVLLARELDSMVHQQKKVCFLFFARAKRRNLS